MERTILHVAIDSFPIQAERFRCPKLLGRPVALWPAGSPRPRVAAVSREARGAGVVPGTPLLVARRLCRDLVALPLDRDLYAGIGEEIFRRLSPFAPVVEAGGGVGTTPAGPGGGRFFLDLTGVARTHSEALDRASRAGRAERAPRAGAATVRVLDRER